jgi:hypothetical protein
MHDGAFVVLCGSVTGVKAHEFPTKGEADDYFRLLRTALNMGRELVSEMILIEDETEYASLRPKFDERYERLCKEPGFWVSLGKKFRDRVRKYKS